MTTVDLYLGDCIGVLSQISDNSIDAVMVDLPYGTTANKWDFTVDMEKLWPLYNRISDLSSPIVMFGDEPFASYLRSSNLKNYRYDWIWEKNKGSDFLNVNRKPIGVHESILVFYRKLPVYHPQMTSGRPYTVKSGSTIREGLQQSDIPSVVTFNNGSRFPRTVLRFDVERGLHPTQKPVPLMEYLIKTYTNPGDTVLDNTMGSGTTGVACMNLGRNFVGIEKDQGYFEIAKKRIEEAKIIAGSKKVSMFDAVSL